MFFLKNYTSKIADIEKLYLMIEMMCSKIYDSIFYNVNDFYFNYKSLKDYLLLSNFIY